MPLARVPPRPHHRLPPPFPPSRPRTEAVGSTAVEMAMAVVAMAMAAVVDSAAKATYSTAMTMPSVVMFTMTAMAMVMVMVLEGVLERVATMKIRKTTTAGKLRTSTAQFGTGSRRSSQLAGCGAGQECRWNIERLTATAPAPVER